MPPKTVMDCTRRRMTMAAVSQPEAARPLKKRAFAGGFVEVEGLRVVLLAELLDLLGGDLGGADGVELLANVKVFKVQFLRGAFGHGQSFADEHTAELARCGK